jgi:hypothetical protein
VPRSPPTNAVARFHASLKGLQVVFDKLTLMLAQVEAIKQQRPRGAQAASRPLNLQPQDLKKS